MNTSFTIIQIFEIISIGSDFGYTSFYMVKLTATITGLVQRVRYRDFIQVSATELGVTGYVRNNPDGTVLVVAEGLPDTLKEFVEYLNEGSLQAKVDGVAVEWGTAANMFDDFSIQ